MDSNHNMEGWLTKKKSKSSMFTSGVRRWFKIQRLEGTEDELALCYFSSNKSKDVKGWIFLSDIVEISEEKSTLTVVSPARTMTVEAQTIGEHRLWITALVKLCPHALYDGETASKHRVGDYAEEKSSSREFAKHSDSKSEERREQPRSRRNSRENSMERERDGRRDLGGGKSGRQSHDDSSTGSSGSRGRGTRQPNTGDDHRKGGNLSYPDASTAARMHSHISGEPDGKMYRGRPPPQQPHRGKNREEDEGRYKDLHRESYDLESYDLARASPSLSREERLQFSREDDELKRQHEDESQLRDSEGEEGRGRDEQAPALVRRKKPAPPPRRQSPSMDRDGDRDFADGDGDTAVEKPVQKRGVSIEDMIDDVPALAVNLDDSSDEEEKLDFKAEKRRYANDAKAQSERDKLENAKSKPPLAPAKPAPSRGPIPSDAKTSHVAGPSVDPGFLDEDWDEADTPPKARGHGAGIGMSTVQTGSQADHNWLDDDFDD